MKRSFPDRLDEAVVDERAKVVEKPAPQTSSAASSGNVPEKTEARRRRPNRAARSSIRSSHAASRWRSGASRVRSSGRRAPSRVAREAARREQLRPRGGKLDREREAVEAAADLLSRSRGATSRPTAQARSAKSTAACVCGSGSSRYSCSPATRSGARLVTSTRTWAQALRTSLTTGAASRRCSKLSSRTRAPSRGRKPVRSSGAPIV